MKTILTILLSVAALPAQWIGTRYGIGTPDSSNNCDVFPQLLWHDQNIYAVGSASIGGPGFDYLTVHRDYCPSDLAFLHVVAIGAAAANIFVPAAVTNTADSWVLTSNDVIAVGTLDQTNVQYVYHQPVPNDPQLVGLNLYSQWMIFWISVDTSVHFMLSEGLVVQVTP